MAVHILSRSGGAPANRLAYIDNLRWSIILLVLAVHSAIPYSHLGPWYVYDPRPVGPASQYVFLTFEANAQAFFMGILFFVAGHFVPAAFDRKGLRDFLRERWVRLGVPTLLFMVVIQPLIICYMMRAWPGGFWQGFLHLYLPTKYFPSGSGPMWFTLALLIFSAVYALGRSLFPRLAAPALAAPGWRGVAATGLGIAVLAFLIRWGQPIGTSFLNMQLCFFAAYVVLFCLGIVAYRQNWLDRLPAWRPAIGWLALAGIVAAWAITTALCGLDHGDWNYLGNGTWESAVYAVWESLFCVFVSVVLLSLYRAHVNATNRATRFLSDNAFGAYFLHTPILVWITVQMQGLDWPPLAKFLLQMVLTIPLTYLAVDLVFRRIPLLKRIL